MLKFQSYREVRILCFGGRQKVINHKIFSKSSYILSENLKRNEREYILMRLAKQTIQLKSLITKIKCVQISKLLYFTGGKLFKAHVIIFLILLISCTSHSYAFDGVGEPVESTPAPVDSRELSFQHNIYGFRTFSNKADDREYFEDVEEWNYQRVLNNSMSIGLLNVWDIGNPYCTNSRDKDFEKRMRERQSEYNSTTVVMSELEKKVINCARNLLYKHKKRYIRQIPQRRSAEDSPEDEGLIDLRSEVTLGRLIYVAKEIDSLALEHEVAIYDTSGELQFKGELVDVCRNILDKYVYY